jgi:hypothetical protein
VQRRRPRPEAEQALGQPVDAALGEVAVERQRDVPALRRDRPRAVGQRGQRGAQVGHRLGGQLDGGEDPHGRTVPGRRSYPGRVPTRPPPPPMRTNDRLTVLVGMAVWLAALIVLALLHRTLAAHHALWWLETCGAGELLGGYGLIMLARRR